MQGKKMANRHCICDANIVCKPKDSIVLNISCKITIFKWVLGGRSDKIAKHK